MHATRLFKDVLVGVDSAGLASHAVLQGFALVHGIGSHLELVHAVHVPPPLWPGIGEEELAQMHASALDGARKKTIESLQEALRSAGIEEDLENALKVYPGHPATVLLKRAEEFQSDLILLGQHTKRSLFDLGSTVRAVLSRNTTPVWVQPGPAGPVKSILVPVDFSEHSHMALEYARIAAQRLDASLHVLHCYDPPVNAYAGMAEAVPNPTYAIDEERKAAQAELDKWVEELREQSVRAEPSYSEGNPARRILQEAPSHDLIVMGTHGRTGLSRFLLGSVAHAVLRDSKKPALVIPNPDRAWILDDIHDRPA